MIQLLKEKAATSRELLDFVSLALRTGPVILTKTMLKLKFSQVASIWHGKLHASQLVSKVISNLTTGPCSEKCLYQIYMF